MKTLLTTGLLLCATATPLFAGQADCDASIEALRAAVEITSSRDDIDPLASLVPVDEGGLCVLRDVSIPVPTGPNSTIFEAREVTWRATWSAELSDLVPQSLALDIRGARIIVQQFRDMEEFAYQMRLIGDLNSAELHLDYTIEPEAKRLVLTSLDVAQTGGNRVALSGVVENFEIAALTGPTPQLDRLMQFSLTELDLRLRNAGMFESMAMAWLNVIYPQFGDTPDEAVANTKAWLTDQIGALPDYLVTQDSREAMKAMVETLPHPNGVMYLALSAEKGLAAQNVMPAFLLGQPTWEMLEEPLAGVRLSAEWQPPRDCDCNADW